MSEQRTADEQAAYEASQRLGKQVVKAFDILLLKLRELRANKIVESDARLIEHVETLPGEPEL